MTKEERDLPMTLTPAFNTLETQPRVRRSTAIAEKIRGMLLSGELKPGNRLPTEEELGKLFQVSRTTLREAIQMLRVSGLLDVTPGRGSYIKKPDLSRAMDDLALYGVCSKVDQQEVKRIHLGLILSLMDYISKQPMQMKNRLYDYTLVRDGSGKTNAKLEAEWHMQLAELGGGQIARMMLSALLKMQQKSREAALEDEDELSRTLSVQMRCNNALSDGDTELAKRIISSYLQNDARHADIKSAA